MRSSSLAGAFAVASLALLATPPAGQALAPACPASLQIAPLRLDFHERDNSPGAITSLTATHPAELFMYVPNSGLLSLSDPGISLVSPPGLQTSVTNEGEPTQLHAYFTPSAPGNLNFTAAWTQLTKLEGPPCTASAAASLAVTAPTPSRPARTLGYSVDHRSGLTGSTNEFVLTFLILSDPVRGDRSPFRMTVRAVKSQRRPSARTPASTVVFDPNKGSVRASTPLVHLEAGRNAEEVSIYRFSVGVAAYPPRGRGRSRRGVEVMISQGSRTLTRYRFATSCSAIFGGLECTPLPKGAPVP
jgi:hypothetical protein